MGKQSTVRIQKKRLLLFNRFSLIRKCVTEEKAAKQSLVEKGNDSSGKWNGSLYGLLEGGQGKAWGTLQAWHNEELSATRT